VELYSFPGCDKESGARLRETGEDAMVLVSSVVSGYRSRLFRGLVRPERDLGGLVLPERSCSSGLLGSLGGGSSLGPSAWGMF
jgi:hypothetical protein